MDIPPSFRSRMTTFKEHITPHVADVYDFVLLRDQAVSERQTVLVPIKFCHIPVSQVLNQQAQSNPIICPSALKQSQWTQHFSLKGKMRIRSLVGRVSMKSILRQIQKYSWLHANHTGYCA